MRVAVSVLLVGTSTLTRTYRAEAAVNVWVVTFAVLPRGDATVVQVVPLVLIWTSKSRVLKAVRSPPAPACRSTTRLTEVLAPRSTCRNLVAASEQNLSVFPPFTVPLTAFAGPSFALHDALPVAGLFNARF